MFQLIDFVCKWRMQYFYITSQSTFSLKLVGFGTSNMWKRCSRKDFFLHQPQFHNLGSDHVWNGYKQFSMGGKFIKWVFISQLSILLLVSGNHVCASVNRFQRCHYVVWGRFRKCEITYIHVHCCFRLRWRKTSTRSMFGVEFCCFWCKTLDFWLLSIPRLCSHKIMKRLLSLQINFVFHNSKHWLPVWM